MLLIDRPEEKISSTEEWVEFLDEMRQLEKNVSDLLDLNQVWEEIAVAEKVLKERGQPTGVA